MPLDDRQHLLPDLRHQRLVRPRGLSHKMQQRLMLGRYPRRSRYGRHWFDALALERHQKAEAVIPQRINTIRVADHRHQMIDIHRKSRFILPSPRVHASVASPKPIADANSLLSRMN